MTRWLVWMAAGALGSGALALAQAPPTRFTPLAQSAQLTVQGAVAADTLILRVQRAAGQAPVSGAQLTVSVDGRSLPAAALADGTWVVQLKDLPAGAPGKLDLVVTHDGVRELLSGKLARPGTLPPAGSNAGGTASARREHQQLAWWLLNIAIVLIAAIAISRRMS
ncbi:MAG: hypothetical protein ACRETG_03715 [Steroidobacteraceae bacterium]